MTLRPIEPAQYKAAKVAGFLYVFQMATAVFGESYVRGKLLVSGDAVQTAQNIAANERLFRIGVASDLITYVAVITLIWALYVVLRPVRRDVTVLALVLRLVENAIAAAVVFNSFVALRLLSGADYLQAFDTEQLAVLARSFIGGQGFGLQIAFVFCGLGSAVFAYVWLKSRYIPRFIPIWGIFSSLLLAIGTMAIMVFPSLGAMGITYMMPMGVYEVGLGLWLMIRGIRQPASAAIKESA
jgi:hypothetical protein